jgi:ubiquinone biosynthesis protein
LVTSGLGLLYLILRLASLFVFGAERRRRFVGRVRGRLGRWGASALGASFIKLGQVMSTRPDVFSAEFIDEMRRLQDQVPAFSFARVKKTIEAELGKPIDELFSELDAEPVAAASVAQVHRGRLTSGEEVAVKVLRPGVRKLIERDGAILKVFAKMMEVSPRARLSDPVGHLEEFIAGVRDQTDLRLEIANYEAFHASFDGFAGARFPEVYPATSGERVLTMEFIRGQKIDEIDPAEHPQLGDVTRNLFMKMCFDDGFVHADLHPGNMLIDESGELVIFDVGLVKRLESDVLAQFIDFSRCMAFGTGADFIAHFKRFHHYMEGTVDWEAIEADSARFIDKYRALNVAELELGGFTNELFALARKHRIRPVVDLALVIVAIVTSEGIAKMLNPDTNTFDEMTRFLTPLLAKQAQAGTAAK